MHYLYASSQGIALLSANDCDKFSPPRDVLWWTPGRFITPVTPAISDLRLSVLLGTSHDHRETRKRKKKNGSSQFHDAESLSKQFRYQLRVHSPVREEKDDAERKDKPYIIYCEIRIARYPAFGLDHIRNSREIHLTGAREFEHRDEESEPERSCNERSGSAVGADRFVNLLL